MTARLGIARLQLAQGALLATPGMDSPEAVSSEPVPSSTASSCHLQPDQHCQEAQQAIRACS